MALNLDHFLLFPSIYLPSPDGWRVEIAKPNTPLHHNTYPYYSNQLPSILSRLGHCETYDFAWNLDSFETEQGFSVRFPS